MPAATHDPDLDAEALVEDDDEVAAEAEAEAEDDADTEDADGPDYATYLARFERWRADFPCRDPRDCHLLAMIVRYVTSSEQAYRRELAHLHTLARRAEASWDADRRAEAEAIAARLSRAPGVAAAELCRSKHGALLMAERWEALADTLWQTGRWSPDQRRLALDLLGTPRELRDGRTPLDPDDAGPSEVAAFRVAFARRQAEALRAEVEEHLGPLDDTDREIALRNLSVPQGPAWRQMMLDEERNNRRKAWAWDRFFGRRLDEQAAARQAKPAPRADPEPAADPGEGLRAWARESFYGRRPDGAAPEPAAPRPGPSSRPSLLPPPAPSSPAARTPAQGQAHEPPAGNRKARRAREAAERRRRPG